MIVSVETSPIAERMGLWRRQIGHRHGVAAERGPRPFAIISYLVSGRLFEERYIPLRELTFVALFDQWQNGGSLTTRLVGAAAAVGTEGLRIGGVQLSRFDKNIRLAPSHGRSGARLDARDGDFFEFALSLERYLERCARHPHFPRARVPRLPVIENGQAADETTLVDLSMLPKRQIIRLGSPGCDLVGRTGTTMFDFANTRFRVAR